MNKSNSFRDMIFVGLGILPLVICVLAGFPRGSTVALIIATFAILYRFFKRAKEAGWPLIGAADPGIRIRNLGIAAFVFLPLLLGIWEGRDRNPQLVLLAAYVSALYFLLAVFEKAGRVVFGFVVTILVLFSAINSAYYLFVGDAVSYHVFASILDTNSGEAFEFLRSPSIPTFLLMFFGLMIPVVVFSWLTRHVVVGGKIFPSSLIKAGAVAIWIACPVNLHRSHGSETVDFYPMREFHKLSKYLEEINSRVSGYRSLEHRFEGTIDESKAATVILVIGEAARRDRLGVYNRRLETTPWLQKRMEENPGIGIVFTDAISTASYTRASVPSLLSVCPASEFEHIGSNPSILKILKSAQLESVLISNQSRLGFHDNFITAFMQDAVRTTYLKNAPDVLEKVVETSGPYDEDLVPPLLEELARPSHGSKLIIIHLAGNHFEYAKRYPPDQAFFPGSSIENDYLNSIRYTDKVIDGFLEAMMREKHPALLLYVSDHGEYLNDFGDGFYDHGFRNPPSRFEFEIPYLCIFNDSFLERRPVEISRMRERRDLPVSLDNVSHTLLGLMGVFDAEYRPEYDLSSEGFMRKPRHIVDSTNNVIPLEKARFDQRKVKP